MATTSVFSQGVLSTFGDSRDNSIIASRDAAGNILINGGAVPVLGGQSTVANTLSLHDALPIFEKKLKW